MKRAFLVLLLMTLILNCVACSTAKKITVEEPSITDDSNMKVVIDSMESEKTDEVEIAQQAYDLIEGAESNCKQAMKIIEAAWHFGIWNAPECKTDEVIERLSAKIGCDISFIEEHGGYTADELVNGNEDFPGWEFCLMTAENCLSAIGVYDFTNEALDSARDLIRQLSTDYTHYQSLKDYYTKVAAYVAYFENISGSYNDLTAAITEYESGIQMAKEPLLFDFG